MAERVAEIQNKLKRRGRTEVGQGQGQDQDAQIDDELDDMETEREIDEDIAMDMNPTDDYNDGDPWGDEMDNRDDYD